MGSGTTLQGVTFSGSSGASLASGSAHRGASRPHHIGVCRPIHINIPVITMQLLARRSVAPVSRPALAQRRNSVVAMASSFHELKAKDIDGKEVSMSALKVGMHRVLLAGFAPLLTQTTATHAIAIPFPDACCSRDRDSNPATLDSCALRQGKVVLICNVASA